MFNIDVLELDVQPAESLYPSEESEIEDDLRLNFIFRLLVHGPSILVHLLSLLGQSGAWTSQIVADLSLLHSVGGLCGMVGGALLVALLAALQEPGCSA